MDEQTTQKQYYEPTNFFEAGGLKTLYMYHFLFVRDATSDYFDW